MLGDCDVAANNPARNPLPCLRCAVAVAPAVRLLPVVEQRIPGGEVLQGTELGSGCKPSQ